MGGLAKGLAVIECFNADRPRQSISEIAQASGLDRATARRCLLTLAHQGYAHWDGKYFTLTPRILRLGTACLATLPLPRIVQPFLDRISDQIGESSSASVLDGSDIVYVARATQKKVMSISLMPGSRLPAYCTSMGRILLAALPVNEALAILEADAPLSAKTRHTLTDIPAIMAELGRIREQGYSANLQEIEIGLCSVAVPIHNTYGRVVAALNFGLTASPEFPDRVEKELLPALREVQQELRGMIGQI
ncbi:helix-turn-helix domain-containing protein [Paracoccus caeni]|uniref:Helix-turn-helix domain-containing protein n=2 Tax=Paracoccus caeni TaxID=657651 RepID=A0A934SC87_9RHOB|nr:helix-turn-helix domain-containing protein [Paracoccus caeni]